MKKLTLALALLVAAGLGALATYLLVPGRGRYELRTESGAIWLFDTTTAQIWIMKTANEWTELENPTTRR